MFRIYRKILHSHEGDFKMFVKSDIFGNCCMAHIRELPDDGDVWSLFGQSKPRKAKSSFYSIKIRKKNGHPK